MFAAEKTRREYVEEVLREIPEIGYKRKNKKIVLRLALKNMFPFITSLIPDDALDTFLFNSENIARDLRKLTEEYEQEEKKRKSDEWKVNNGYGRNPNQALFEVIVNNGL